MLLLYFVLYYHIVYRGSLLICNVIKLFFDVRINNFLLLGIILAFSVGLVYMGFFKLSYFSINFSFATIFYILLLDIFRKPMIKFSVASRFSKSKPNPFLKIAKHLQLGNK